MRKLLLDHEMEGARAQQQQMMMGMPPGMPPMMMQGMMPGMMMPNGNMAFNPAMMGMPNGMFNPAMMGMAPLGFHGMPQGGQPPMGVMPGMMMGPPHGPGNGEVNPDGSSAAMMGGATPNNSNDGRGSADQPTNTGDNAGEGDAANDNNPAMPAMNMNPMNPGAMGMDSDGMGQVPNMGESPAQVGTTI